MQGVPVHNGLRPISHDTSRDFNHKKFWPVTRQLFGSANALPGLASTLGRTPVCINDQGSSNFCTGFEVSEAIGNQLGIPMSPETQVALEGKIAGAPILVGTDPKTALSSGLLGAFAKTATPLTFANQGWTTPAEWQMYPLNFFASVPNGRPSYYAVTFGDPGDMDVYDSVKLALNDAKQDPVPGFSGVLAFGFWYKTFNQVGSNGIIPALQPNELPITRHAYGFIDWKTINGVEYLVAQLSQGEEFGDKGLCYFTRENMNQAWQNPATNAIGLYIYRNTNPSFWTSFSFNILHTLGII